MSRKPLSLSVSGILGLVIVATGVPLSASAGPDAPPVSGTESIATFVVPDPGPDDRDFARLKGSFDFGRRPGVSTSDFTFSLACFGGRSYMVYPFLVHDRQIEFEARLALDEVGHTCVFEAVTNDDRKVIWTAPFVSGGSGKQTTYLYGTIVTPSHSGGL
ncbi:hypothetical protein B7R54_06520 [Subtercola boreus]|uniref:Uncharacterized protein n=1 Tax=Subtercola boreus TaxID=120213 RepID=A0A3E0VG35_9MICO|nr:hypothetical protein [Subtercola boreus]RFA08916.1 hypothetical protein B7R54_06520 [Subtercola boreus]TQL54099.1 hypothetical protein FB464_1629 [Subtercola boreus]